MLNNLDYKIILASQSPRRQYLLKELGLEFEVRAKDVEEDFPDYLRRERIPLHLCEKKSDAFAGELADDELLITADTIVWVDTDPLNKPKDHDDAVRMLKILSGRMHEVITAVCLRTTKKKHSFYVTTDVEFKQLSDEEIEYYITNYKPFDKAGAYGAQEWIGYIGIKNMHGSYFNVMGLPVKELYEELQKFGRKEHPALDPVENKEQ
jgi:septum formation protein